MAYLRQCSGKQEWPELVGERGSKAAKIIENENEDVRAIVLPEGSGVPRDLRCDRVWVFVDERGVVVDTPVVM
uniref:Proteinase inhibitor BTIw1 n=1 Tax=Fagopyrum esculentum TaxID=3617 RepID=A2CHN2_FAGES|nr:proteinase inhibitor BTIw1 [Fagopyrum esculentum]